MFLKSWLDILYSDLILLTVVDQTKVERSFDWLAQRVFLFLFSCSVPDDNHSQPTPFSEIVGWEPLANIWLIWLFV